MNKSRLTGVTPIKPDTRMLPLWTSCTLAGTASSSLCAVPPRCIEPSRQLLQNHSGALLAVHMNMVPPEGLHNAFRHPVALGTLYRRGSNNQPHARSEVPRLPRRIGRTVVGEPLDPEFRDPVISGTSNLTGSLLRRNCRWIGSGGVPGKCGPGRRFTDPFSLDVPSVLRSNIYL